MDAADYPKERSDEIVEPTSPDPKKLDKYLTKIPSVPFLGSEGDNLIETSNNLLWYPTFDEAPDQIQVPNGGKSIKSAVMKRGKKLKAAMVDGGKKFATAMVNGSQKSWVAIVKGGKKFGPPCINACAVGGVQVAVALATS
ncbi:elongation factor 1-alpha [Ziziphus jujuba]|uniref:Elongation factor 1-alpha n=1 Tax=Ziziphus jujuba TaxID=326968 RepID=A0A6P6GAY3_ZIZJJ|nr:elongation factor 1-alpha [Ziziphus jujuba]